MISHQDVLALLKRTKIHNVQFDVNGVCNVGCWFCPVKYETSPARQNMPLTDIHRILDTLLASRQEDNGILAREWNHIYPAHYNEILLYPHLEGFFHLLEERHLRITILTNGTPLRPSIADMLKKYDHIIAGINLNIPAIEREEWKKQVKNSDTLYDRLRENIDYVLTLFPERVQNKTLFVGMNGITERSLYSQGGWIETGTFLPIDPETLPRQWALFQELYPSLHIYMNDGIIDRDNLLAQNEIISLNTANTTYNVKHCVTGCRNGAYNPGDTLELYGRPFSWIHIDSFGNLFLCCQDFHITTTFGNLLSHPLNDIWFSPEHITTIVQAFQGMCTHCVFAQWRE